jgi:CRISPR system Cascade subunit CasE
VTALWLIRARLRDDAQVGALAPLLLPDNDDDRALASHRLVWSFMTQGPDARRDFLWREEAPGRFLVLAPRPPGDSALFDLCTKPFAPELAPGDRLRFALRANATIARRRPGQRGVRGDVVMHALHPIEPGPARAMARPAMLRDSGAAWLGHIGARAGFSPDGDALTVDGYRRLRIPRPGRKDIALGLLEFTGTLCVDDPPRFIAALSQGFGRGRAFGCGLMLIRRL